MWGTFDEESFGEQLAARIARHELGRRLPVAEIVTFAPGDRTRPTRLDAGEPARPLGPWSPERVAELSAGLDCVVVTSVAIGPGTSPFLLQADSRPMVWHAVAVDGEPDGVVLRKVVADHAYVSVVDEDSKRRLEELGVEREVTVLPHPAVLAPRLFPPALLEKRLAYLRLMGWYPAEGGALLVHGPVDGADAVERLAAASGDLPVVVTHTRLAGPHLRLPDVGVEDLVAAVAGSAAVITTSPAVAATAAAYGKRHLLVDGGTAIPEQVPPAPDPEVVERYENALDASFDRVAAIAAEAAARRPDPGAAEGPVEVLGALAALRRASAVQARRLVAERLAFADHSAELTERLRQAEESLAAHGAVVAAQEGVIADQRRALLEHQEAMLSLATSVEAQMAELARARAVFEGIQEHVRSLETRLGEEAAARSRAEAELSAILGSRTFRLSTAIARVVGRARRGTR